MPVNLPKYKKPKYYLNQRGEFVIENYNFSKPLANFFPGIAGKYGIPMWVFYVNRGQGIISFGTKDKDHPILEFFPANKAWQFVTLRGFRTFIKLFSGGHNTFYEPFHNSLANLKDFNLINRMSITPHGLKIEEDNLSLGLKTDVEYFTIPNDSYAALVRVLTLKNTARTKKRIQVLDGLPQIIPYGTSNLFLKKLSRTIEAWMNIKNLEKGVPFYKLDVDPTDRPEVIHIEGGNFYLGFLYDGEKPRIIKPIADPQYIFGPITDFSYPGNFLAREKFLYPEKQKVASKTPCAFSLLELELAPNKERIFYSVVGCMRSLEMLNNSVKKIAGHNYLALKKEENKNIIEELQQNIFTRSSSKEFNSYAANTYLDNILRGGYPVIFGAGTNKTVFYLYARKHGDLERDYNKFQLQPTYFSQGNGNYRDMNQNRRCDVWFNPEIKDDNLIYFFSLIQPDGFNPLVIKGASFMLKDETDLKIGLKHLVSEKNIAQILSFLNKPFTPGDVIFFLEENKIKFLPKADPPTAEKLSYDELLSKIISNSIKIQEAETTAEGFWTDHWHYNLDLLESYLGVYPEKLKEIAFKEKSFTYYDNTEIVKPRCEKYLLYHGLPRQLHSVMQDPAKKEMMKERTALPHTVRTQYGKGDIYQVTLMNKLLCLFVNKMSSFDPFGVGIEMEANKPNWFDALNGLPALFGSSLCETFELKRLIILIRSALTKANVEKVYLTEEIHAFLIGLYNLIKEYLRDSPLSGTVPKVDYQYWDKSYSLKEGYRQKTRLGFSGNEFEIEASELVQILDNALEKINMGIEKAWDKKRKVYYAYFINEVAEYEPLNLPFIRPVKFIQKKLPLFLEGQVHALRLAKDINEARALYKGTRSTELYDKKLKMYKVTSSLKSQPEEIGRCRVFTPGWLENESIWLHMEYKYLLELLRSGLYAEFYQDFKNALIPFQNPQRYGRSILENSSFLVSSAFPDKNLHGNGFVARLSGSTAEFLHIWLIMNLGTKPFFLNEKGELNLCFKPLLTGWLFDRKGNYSFNFLGKILVTYHNPKRKNTYGGNSARIKKIIFNDKDGNPVELPSDTIPHPYAQQVRSRQIKKIDINLAIAHPSNCTS